MPAPLLTSLSGRLVIRRRTVVVGVGLAGVMLLALMLTGGSSPPPPAPPQAVERTGPLSAVQPAVAAEVPGQEGRYHDPSPAPPASNPRASPTPAATAPPAPAATTDRLSKVCSSNLEVSGDLFEDLGRLCRDLEAALTDGRVATMLREGLAPHRPAPAELELVPDLKHLRAQGS